jgi:thiol-disulfide isomerase/thioredoxin
VIYADYTPTIPGANDTAGSISPEQLPTLGGAYHNQLKEGATEILHSPYGPLYAHWNYGKGIVGSFMCDLNGTWSADFLNAEAGATIINNIISHLANERIPDDSASPVVGNQVGDLCPSVQLSVLTGDGVSARTIDPSALGKITIIYFWGAWCGPCKAELPFFDEVASMFPDQVDVIAIHSIVSASDGSECITKNYPNSKIIFAVDNKCDETDIPGIRGEFFLALGFHDIYPATVILDENGMIIYSGCKNFHSVEDLLAELPNSLLEDTQANKHNPSTATVSTPGNNDIAGSFMCDLNGTWSADFIASEEGAEIINRIIFSLANPPEETE